MAGRFALPPLPEDAEHLAALCRAALAVSSDLDLDQVLGNIVEAARDLTGARYAACGVPGEEGFRHFVHRGLTPAQVERIGHLPEGHGLLGLTLRTTRPIRLDSIASHPASSGFPPHHPPMTTFLGVPIVSRGRTIGHIYLSDKPDGARFLEVDETAVGVLAGFAAVAITNAHRHVQVNTELERRRDELDATTRRLRALSDRTLWVMESERRLIAQELHDGVGQVLAAAIMAAESIGGGRGDPVETAAGLSKMLREAVHDVRRMSHGLRPTVLDELGADVAIRDAADQLSTGACRIVYATSGPVRRLPEPVETVVYRVAQEAMTNAVRHSGASRVEAQLRFDPDQVRLTVTDNGIGLPANLREQGLGITGMRERARLVDGAFEISSPSGHGVRVSLSVPTPAADHD